MIRGRATCVCAALALALVAPAGALARQLVVDPSHSQVVFSVTKWGLVTVEGRVHGVSGTIDWDPARPGAASTVWEARVDSIDTGEPKRDAALRDPEYFDARRHPMVTFRSTRARVVDARTLSVDGELTIRGVTRPVTTTVRWLGARDVPDEGALAVFEASFVINRRDFGVVGGRVLGPVISNEVRIDVRAVARAAR